MKKTTAYKMRAECQADLSRFLSEVGVLSFTASAFEINGLVLPDMVAEFTSTLSLKEVKVKLGEIEDGHVMLETVALAAKYTGDRG